MKTTTLLATLLALSASLSPGRASAQEQEPSNLPDEYLKNLKNYQFVNTRGMRDLAPSQITWIPDHRQDEDEWEFPTEEEREKLKEMGITFPDFEFLEGGEIAPGQKRQRTHTVEHVIYAMPGDAVSLYPYYGLEEYLEPNDQSKFESTKDYFETFSHWYDFQTGGRVIHTSPDGTKYDLLDFPYDRGYIQISDNHGFYGGIYMSPGTHYPRPYQVATAAEYIDAVNKINNNGGRGTLIITADLDFSDYGDADVPMLGDNHEHRFSGTLNGQGHTISNLKIKRNHNEVGLIGWAENGAKICNLVIASTCSFEGQRNVGLIGKLNGGALTVSHVSTSARVIGNAESEPHASGILGSGAEGNDINNYLIFEDLYVGGEIGTSGNTDKRDTALCGWLNAKESTTSSRFTNIVVDATLHGPELKGGTSDILNGVVYVRHDINDGPTYTENPTEKSWEEKHGRYSLIFTNCHGNLDSGDKCWNTFSDLPQMEGWKDTTTPGTIEIEPIEENLGEELLSTAGHRPWYDDDQERRKAGTSAVFYFPESLEGEWDRNKEYVIAADFSQTFEPQTHINVSELTITEPVVAFRHIFRIRDARDLTGTLQNNNKAYVRSHQHKVTARVGANFQIRLDSPLPTGWGTSGGVTNYYVKNGNTYDRIRQFGIKVLDSSRNPLPGDQGFQFGIDIRMRRSKADVLHASKDQQYRYHTMLTHGKVEAEAHYIVQIIAKDNNGNEIKTSDGSDMVLMEYDIRFLPETAASLVTEATLYGDDKYRHARDEYMKERYGTPADLIDFDNYFKLNQLTDDALKSKMISYSVPVYQIPQDGWYTKDNLPVWDHYSTHHTDSPTGTHHSFYKWPISWERSTYSFGYNYRYNYNMYMLATHSTNVPYHHAADRWNGRPKDPGNPEGYYIADENGTANNKGDGNGLYDRLYYKTKRMKESNPDIKQEQGYFYYVNAASDPGVSARLNFSLPCPGSRVIVSAWVAEMTARSEDYESANLSFNIVAVKESGERITLHNFITGYLGDDGNGKWYNVYYTFVPRLAEFNIGPNEVDHYELELAHNGKSSVGADYAIDDIRAYVVPPVGEADHFGYACDDTDLDLRVETSFETLLEKSGEYEAFGDAEGQNLTLYYAFVDKEKYDANPKGDFSKYVVNVNGGAKSYSSLKFKSNFSKNTPYLYEADRRNTANGIDVSHSMTENGDRLIVFDTQALAGKLRVGKEYYVVFKSAPEGEVPEDLATFFDLNGECSYNCEMIVRPSLKIKFDGEVQEDFRSLAVCENQWPVIQANVWSIDTDKTPVEVDKNAYFDWFDGSINDFENYRFVDYAKGMDVAMTDAGNDVADRKEHYLKYALSVFRQHYWEAENVTDVKYMPDMAVEGNLTDVPELEQWMLDIIDIACQPDATGRKRLLLHNTSFVLPPKDIEDGKAKDKVRIVAIPIVDLYSEDNPTYPSGNISVCPSPTEIGVAIAHRTPILRHGLADASINYPSALNDVPLRVGLNQVAPGKDFVLRRINIPVREAASSDGETRSFKLVDDAVLDEWNNPATKHGAILLAQTDDPEYKDLGSIVIKDGKETDSDHILWVGEIKAFNAEARGNAAAIGNDNFVAQIYDNITLKEGYFYRFKFRFEEVHDEEIDSDDETVCQGQDVFTVKVVPEYMQWTGDRNLSWDNDENWRRVAAAEVLKTDAKGSNTQFTDGASANRHSFAPLGFTRTVIGAPMVNDDGETEGENPWLYAPTSEGQVDDDYTPGKRHDWTSDPAPTTADAEGETTESLGAPTSLIQYDMTGYVYGENTPEEIRCRPWTANTCAEIHFLPGATMMHQEHLTYDRAWVDVELDHSRWYLLSTPLQDVYAGDFYLPTLTARQQTELFREIKFSTETNDRFAPAVYQRGWDKGEARVYEFGNADARNAAVRTFWSHVYNDVAEPYGEGNAFSIKTDVSKATDAADKVLFRLPKADAEYSYYSAQRDDAGKPKQTGHTTTLDRRDAYRLNASNGTLTSSTANAGRYFLVGNPFMTHFDIKRFLEENSDVLEQRYWLITEQGQTAGVITEGGVITASPYPADDTTADPSAVAPMQGFFVEARQDATSVALTYDESMMRRYDAGGSVLTEATRSADALPTLKITAINDGRLSSAAVLVEADGMEPASADAFDMRDLSIPATVFTAREGKARAINFCSEAEGVEIGLIADDDTVTTLVFEGTENFGDMMLLDRSDNSITPLSEVETLSVSGPVNGRFYITAGLASLPASEQLSLRCDNGVLTATDLSASGHLEMLVCDALGRTVADLSTGSATLSVGLPEGLYVVRMANAYCEKAVKINL